MFPEKNRCINPAIYIAQSPALSFGENRALVLGKFAEKELDLQLEGIIREHLTKCDCCTEFLKQMEDQSEIRFKETELIYANCPSSKNLDRFVFAAEEVPSTELQKIEKHLQECILCKEEIEWLKSTEAQKVSGTYAPRRNWIQYVSIAAALFFMALSIYLFSQRAAVKNTEERLRAAAVIKGPDQIDYGALQNSTISLPDRMAAVYQKGVESLREGRYQEAIRHLELVSTAHPEHSGAVYLLGYSHFHMNEPERAFELCDRAEKMMPQSLERCLMLCNIALRTGHFGRAIREISGLHHAAPNHPEVKETYDRVMAITRDKTLKL